MDISANRLKKQKYRFSSDTIFDIVNILFWIIILVIILYPLWLIIIASFSDPTDILAGRVKFWPVGFSVMGYQAIFRHSQLMRSYLNSIIYSVSGTAVSVFVTMMGAYGLSRYFAGKRVVNFLIVFTMFFSGGLIPSFLINRAIGLYDNRLILIISGAVSVWNLMIARTYITTSIPNELYEAAVIDGASHLTYFFSCILPLSGTIIAVLCVYSGVAKWNDYFTALVYIRTPEKLPLQTVLRGLIATMAAQAQASFFDSYEDSQGITEAIRKAEVAKYCSIVVSTVPAVLLYVFMQKFFIKGVTIGSLKG